MTSLVSGLFVGDEGGFDGAGSVGFGGSGVRACGVQSGVSHEVGDDDDVDAVAQELGAGGYLYLILWIPWSAWVSAGCCV